MAPKLGKSTDHDQNLIISEGCRNIQTCQIAGHSSRVPNKMSEIANLICFTKLRSHHNEENQQTMIKI